MFCHLIMVATDVSGHVGGVLDGGGMVTTIYLTTNEIFLLSMLLGLDTIMEYRGYAIHPDGSGAPMCKLSDDYTVTVEVGRLDAEPPVWCEKSFPLWWMFARDRCALVDYLIDGVI